MKRHNFDIIGLIIVCALLGITAKQAIAQPPEQYKKNNRDAIALMVDGKYDEAISEFQAQYDRYESEFTHHHDRYPADLEALFGLAVANAHKGRMNQAMKNVNMALDQGLPFGRFLAGPRELLAPLLNNRQFRRIAEQQFVELLHGPVVSDVTDNQAEFWVRTVHEVSVTVIVSTNKNMSEPVIKSSARTKADRDFTAVLKVTGLSSDTQYYYQMQVDDSELPEMMEFRTFPEETSASQFEIGFGGGAGFTPWFEHMWNTIESHKLLAFLLLGDNVYIDHPTYPDVQRYCYYRRQSRPEYRSFAAKTPLFAIWDDHDFTTNDGWGGPETFTPAWKPEVWKIFKENWNNPYYAYGEKKPGCWFDFSIGDVDFIMLDGRYYRMGPNEKNRSMLGQVQKEWLFERLSDSKATFKVIASPVPWAYGVKSGSPDPWQGYKMEREEIFSFIEENRIEGVILLSADRHRSDAWKIVRDPAYPLYEFESSKLTNVHTHEVLPSSLFGYNENCSFGKLLFNMDSEDPSVTYQIYSIDNEQIHEMTVSRSDLEF